MSETDVRKLPLPPHLTPPGKCGWNICLESNGCTRRPAPSCTCQNGVLSGSKMMEEVEAQPRLSVPSGGIMEGNMTSVNRKQARMNQKNAEERWPWRPVLEGQPLLLPPGGSRHQLWYSPCPQVLLPSPDSWMPPPAPAPCSAGSGPFHSALRH